MATKYYYMGKRFNTPWQVLVEKIKRFLGLIFIAIIIASVVIGIALVGRMVSPKIVTKEVEKEIILDNLTGKIDELKASLIKDIWDNERAGKNEADGLITWDPNPNRKSVQIASIGTCQYKVSTVQYYETKLHQKTLTGKEAVLLALDDTKCKDLMYEIIFTEKDGWKNWLNSGIKVGAANRLALIKQLEN